MSSAIPRRPNGLPDQPPPAKPVVGCIRLLACGSTPSPSHCRQEGWREVQARGISKDCIQAATGTKGSLADSCIAVGPLLHFLCWKGLRTVEATAKRASHNLGSVLIGQIVGCFQVPGHGKLTSISADLGNVPSLANVPHHASGGSLSRQW